MVKKAFHDRLRRMRREERSGASNELPSWLRDRLGRAHGRRQAGTCALPQRLATFENELGRFAAREQRFPLSAPHGDWRLDEISHAHPGAFALLTKDASLLTVDPERSVFLDTETTGLEGGAGTWVYMIGLGTFDDDSFRLWQGFLREPNEEPALLHEVTRRIDERETIVSFFGKSFDRHRLQDRMLICGIEPPFAERPHLDLYHPLRRLAGGAFPDGRLVTCESELAGVMRSDDLPGAFAPAAWFDYLGGGPHQLEAVFRHNADDVLSLVVLAAYLGRVLFEERNDGRALRGCATLRARAISRALLELGDREEALVWLDRALQRGGEDPELELQKGEALRLLGRLPEARATLDAVAARDHDWRVPGLISLAKLHEHATGDVEAAQAACLRARDAIQLEPWRWTRFVDDVERRLARLSGRGSVRRSSNEPRS